MAKNDVVMAATEIDILEGKVGEIAQTLKTAKFDLAPILYQLQIGNAHIARGYSNFASYCEGHFGMGQSTAKNLLAIAKRFSEVKDGAYIISDKWREYGFARLQIITSLTNEEIENNGITATTPIEDVKRLAKVAKLPKKTETAENSEAKTETAENTEAKSETETAENTEAKSETETAENTEAKREQTFATIPQSDIAKALSNKTKASELAKWIEEQANKGLQYVYIELNK